MVSTSFTVRSPTTRRITASLMLRSVCRRLADLEEVLVGIHDPVLHHPLHVGRVQVAGEHVRLGLEALAGVLAADVGLHGAEAELLLELALHRHLQHPLDAEGQAEVQAGIGAAHVLAEAQHHGDLLRLHLVEAGDHRPDGQEQDQEVAQHADAAAGGCWISRKSWGSTMSCSSPGLNLAMPWSIMGPATVPCKPPVHSPAGEEAPMEHKLPDLPYAHDALAPHISRETLEFHHDKHHAAYVTNLNNLIKGTPHAEQPLEDIVRTAPAGGIFNNAAQVWNHTFYFAGLKPGGGGEPRGALLDAIAARWGSFAALPGGVRQVRRRHLRQRLGLAGEEARRQARHHLHEQRRHPADRRRHAPAVLRRLGARVLHRHAQRAPEVRRELVEGRRLGRRGAASSRG